MSNRDVSFDIAKSVAIFMVIYWHTMSYRTGFELSNHPSYAANFIISINMPLFFMISGYFSRNLHESGCWKNLLKRLMFYFWPMFVFKFLFVFIDVAFLGKGSIVEAPLILVKSFLFQGWFFQALAICDIITYIAFRFVKYWQRIIICLLGVGVCLFGAGRIWYVSNVVPMIPFYWFGLFLLPTILKRSKIYAMLALIGIGVLVGVTCFSGNIATNGLAFYWDRFYVYNPEMQKIVNMMLRFIVGCVGSMGILWIIKVVVAKCSIIQMLNCFGKETLGIYFLQGWLIKTCVVPFFASEVSVFVLFLSSSLVFVCSYLIVRLVKMYDCIGKIFFGRCT